MENKPFRMFWGSSYDRGLQFLLEMWPQVLEKIPNAELHICYGWNLYIEAHSHNPQMMVWKEHMDKLMTQKGIFHYGRISKKEVIELTKKCDVWAYYCNFNETNCITALSCIQYGAVPITMDRAGLKDTAFIGTRLQANAEDKETKDLYLQALVYAYENPKWLKEQRKIGQEKISEFYWENISTKWSQFFK